MLAQVLRAGAAATLTAVAPGTVAAATATTALGTAAAAPATAAATATLAVARIDEALDLAYRRDCEPSPCGEGGIAGSQALRGVAADGGPLHRLAVRALLGRERLAHRFVAADAFHGSAHARLRAARERHPAGLWLRGRGRGRGCRFGGLVGRRHAFGRHDLDVLGGRAVGLAVLLGLVLAPELGELCVERVAVPLRGTRAPPALGPLAVARSASVTRVTLLLAP